MQIYAANVQIVVQIIQSPQQNASVVFIANTQPEIRHRIGVRKKKKKELPHGMFHLNAERVAQKPT